MPEVSELERTEALRLIGAAFASLPEGAPALLMAEWWRFRMFANCALHFLIHASNDAGGASDKSNEAQKAKQQQTGEEAAKSIGGRSLGCIF